MVHISLLVISCSIFKEYLSMPWGTWLHGYFLIRRNFFLCRDMHLLTWWYMTVQFLQNIQIQKVWRIKYPQTEVNLNLQHFATYLYFFFVLLLLASLITKMSGSCLEKQLNADCLDVLRIQDSQRFEICITWPFLTN